VLCQLSVLVVVLSCAGHQPPLVVYLRFPFSWPWKSKASTVGSRGGLGANLSSSCFHFSLLALERQQRDKKNVAGGCCCILSSIFFNSYFDWLLLLKLLVCIALY
jgi:hypothetical protein